jgi:hypothetical protein
MSISNQSTRSRAWMRFSLRAVILVLTMGCIGLAYFFNHCRRERAAVDAVVRAGGKVSFERQGETPTQKVPVWLRSLLGEEPFRTPLYVTLRGKEIDDEFLASHLPAFGSAERLVIKSPNVSDKGLAYLPNKAAYEILWLDCAEVTDAGMEHLAVLKRIDSLALNCDRLTPVGIRRLKGLVVVRDFISVRDERNREALRLLESEVEFSFVTCPATAVLDHIAFMGGVSINFDQLPNDLRDRPFTLTKQRIKVSQVLDQLFEPVGFTYVVADGGIKITSKEAAEEARAGLRAAIETFPDTENIEVDW